MLQMMTSTSIQRQDGTWILRVVPPEGAPQVFTCATEEMAKRLEAVFVRTAGPRRTARLG